MASASADRPLGGRPGRTDRRVARAVALGVAGAMATFTALTLIWVFAVPPFLPADESAHTDYAMQVTHGHLPIAGQPFHAEFPQLGQRTLRQHVSNHPPLYYVFAGPVLRIGAAVGRPLVGILAARGLTALFGLAAVVLAAVLAGLVARTAGRRARAQLMVVAAGLTATIPSFVAASGAVQNDSLTILFTMAALSLLAWVVRSGATRGRIAALTICCTAGMLCRSTFIQVLLVVLITVFVAANWPREGKILPLHRDRIRAGLLQVAVIGGVAFLGAGWFYILNKHRYGDFVGANAVNKLVAGRALEPGAESLFSFFTYPRTWWIQIVQLSGGYGELRLHQPATIEHLATLLAVLLCASVGAVLFAVARGRGWNDRRGWLLVAGLFVVLAISFIEIAVHATAHGSENNRYLLDGIAFWGVGVGGALLLLGFRRAPVVPLAVMVIGSIGALRYMLFIARRQPILAGRGWFDALATSMAHVGMPGARAVLGLFVALLVAGLLAQAIALVWLGNRVVDDPVLRQTPPKHAAQEASA